MVNLSLFVTFIFARTCKRNTCSCVLLFVFLLLGGRCLPWGTEQDVSLPSNKLLNKWIALSITPPVQEIRHDFPPEALLWIIFTVSKYLLAFWCWSDTANLLSGQITLRYPKIIISTMTHFAYKKKKKHDKMKNGCKACRFPLWHTSRRKPYRDQISPLGSQGFLSAHILVCWAETRHDTPNSVSTILCPSPYYKTAFTLFDCRSLDSTTR